MSKNATVKISLESLGLQLSNTPPKFLLNQQEMENSNLQSLQKGFVFVSDISSEDSGSIVVLGKSSLASIQAKSLASYQQICLKSMAMDCKSIISSLTPSEVEEKLAEVLQENLRLKETLERNNLVMKEHLNVLVSRQQELSKVHEAHRQKFAETKNLVSVLKTENIEYKTRMEELNKERTDQWTQTDNQNEASDISMELCEKGGETEIMKLMEKCEQQDQEIVCSHRIVAFLKEQLKSLYQSSFNFIKLEDLQSKKQPGEELYSKHFVESFTRYNEKLQTLGKCYSAQIARYTSIQERLKRCSEILMENHDASETKELQRSLESLKHKELQEHRSKLFDEELEIIRERQEMLESQIEIQQIFTSYNSTLLEVERLRKEKERFDTLQKDASLHDERLDEAKASLRESQRLLENERHSLEQVRFDLTSQKEKFERERNRLQIEEGKLIEANVALHEEASSILELNEALHEQLKIYETEWTEQTKLCDALRLEKNKLLDHVRKLEEEKNQLMTMGFSHRNPID